VKLMTGHELPPELQPTFEKAKRLEWLTIAYLTSATILVFLVLGSSQAMKAAWIEDMLSLIPPIAFLIAARHRHREPSGRWPFGQHRAVEAGYLVSAVALLTVGLYLLYDSVLKLAAAEHPPIGLVEVFDGQIWLGWLMIAVALYSAIPAYIIGRAKLPLADDLHDKVLQADAKMNRADWLTGSAAALGVLGIGLGWWWADAVAAIVIALDIVHDGAKYSRAAVGDLLDSRPTTYDESEIHPLVHDIRRCVASWDWIERAAVRMRESGHVINVEVIAVPRSEAGVVARVEEGAAAIRELDWKVRDVVVGLARELEGASEDLIVVPRP
jgi:divalent metal cation (Fe/Co/Zn/Cd) transporter